MVKEIKKVLFGLLILVTLLFLNFLVSAQVLPPEAFYGSVSFSTGEAILDNSNVLALIDGNVVGSTVVRNGQYGYGDFPLIIQDDDKIFSGKTVTFEIDGKQTNENAIYENGAVTQLDLTITQDGSSPPSSGSGGGGGSGGGSGGGGGGSSSASSSDSTNSESSFGSSSSKCTEDWSCEDWSNKEDACGVRVCTDVNDCGSEELKPEIERSCTGTTSLGITGNVVGGFLKAGKFKTNLGLLFLMVVSMLFILVAVFRAKNKREQL